MKKKGWSREEIDKAVGILNSEEKKKKHAIFRKTSSRLIYWITILILITINFFISLVLVPFLLFLEGYALYFIIATIAVVFGMIFNFMMQDLEHLEKKHHIFAIIFIPLIAVVNIFIIVGVADRIDSILNLHIAQSPITISVIYVFFFVLPYLFGGVKRM